MGYFWSLLDRNLDRNKDRNKDSRTRAASAPYELSDGLDAGKTPPKDAPDRLFYRHGSDHGLEDLEALGAAQLGLAGAFGMRHHPQHVPARTTDAGDVIQ